MGQTKPMAMSMSLENQCVAKYGVIKMLMFFAENWDSQQSGAPIKLLHTLGKLPLNLEQTLSCAMAMKTHWANVVVSTLLKFSKIVIQVWQLE